MTVSDLKLGINRESTQYGPFSYGTHAGEPVVDFAVSKSDDNALKIQSIESIFEGYNWKRKLASGFARLQFNGQNLFDGQHTEGIGEFSRLVNARFVDFEVTKRELQNKPSRELQNLADYYRVFVPKDREFDEDVMEFYSEQANRYGNVDFLFKVNKYGDDEYVNDIVREYNIYDSHVWLYPRGTMVKTVSESSEIATKYAKPQSWNVSPRLGVMLNVNEEIFNGE